jgi:hypothetical protein
LVHGRARVPLSQTWHSAVDEGSLRVLCIMVSILATVAQLKSVPGVVRMTLIGLIIWHAVIVLTYVAWLGSQFWKQEPNLHGATWAFEAILSLCHLGALLVVLDHLAVYGRFLRAKIRVSELEVRYTVPEVKGGDGFAVIQTPFCKIITDTNYLRVGQEARDLFKDPSQWVLVPVSAPFLPRIRVIYMGCQTGRAHDPAS